MNKKFWIVAVLLTVAFAVALYVSADSFTWVIAAVYGVAVGLAFTLLHNRGRKVRAR